MNTLISLFCLAVLHLAAAEKPSDLKEYKARSVAAREKCRVENNMTKEVLDDWVKNAKIPEGESGKCYLGCYMSDLGHMVDGKLSVPNIQATNALKWTDKTTLDKANEVVATCSEAAKLGGTGSCAVAYEFIACKQKEIKKVGLKLPQPVETAKPK